MKKLFNLKMMLLAVILLVSGKSWGQNYQSFDASGAYAWTDQNWSAPSLTNGCVSSGMTNAFTAGNIAYFCTPNGQGVGNSLITIGGIIATENYTHNPSGGTLSTNGNVVSIDVADSKVLTLGSVNISTASGTGFIKTGSGSLSWGGGYFPGGFTLNSGTMIAAGINAMGGVKSGAIVGATGYTLTINGGIITGKGSTPYDYSEKYPNGIVIGGDFQIGTSNATGDLTFSNNMSLGAPTRTITLGTSATVTFGGIISNTSTNGLTFSATSYGTGAFVLSGLNTYSGTTTISGGTLKLNANGGALKSGNAVTISGGTLEIAQSQSIGDFSMTSGTLKVDAGQTLTITGTYSVSGGTINNQGTIILQGSSAQSFPGSSTVINNGTSGLMTNLTIDNSSGVSIDKSFSVTTLTINPNAKLTNSTGKTLTVSTFNINSSSSGTGTFVDNGTLTNTNATVNQYLSSARNWYVSSPVSGSTLPSGYTYYQYDETGNHSSDPAGPYWFTPSGTFTPGQGYIALPGAAGSTLTFSGTLNSRSTDVAIALTNSGVLKTGFNLIGNPYPAHLTWTQTFVDNNSAKIDPTIWYRTNAGTVNLGGDANWSFNTYNAHSGEASPGGTTGIIPPMQAFWVHVASAAVSPQTLTLNSSDNLILSHQSSNPLKVRTLINTDRQRLRLQVSNGTSTDETLIYFDASASNAFDNYDSPKMSNNNVAVPEIYTTVGTEKLVINGLNSISANTEIPLGFTTGQSNAFSIKATEFSNFDSNTKVYLKDKLSGTEIDLTDGSAYTFASDIASTTNRFSLIFKVVGVTTDINTASGNQGVLIYKNANNLIAVNCKDVIGRDAVVSIYNSVGQKLATKQITATTTVIDNTFTSGVYVVTVNNSGKSTTRKVILN